MADNIERRAELPVARVRRLIAAGAPVEDAIRIVIGGSIPKWAARHGINRIPATMSITGSRVPPARRVVEALSVDLGCTEAEIRELLTKATEEAVARQLVVGV